MRNVSHYHNAKESVSDSRGPRIHANIFITSRWSALAHAYHVWSTSINVFMSYLVHRRTDTDRQTHRQTDRQTDTVTCCDRGALITKTSQH